MFRAVIATVAAVTMSAGTAAAKDFTKDDFIKLMNSPGWEVQHNTTDLKTWRLRVEGQPVFVMKGEAVLDHPVDKVVYVWMDGNRKKEWLDGFSSARQIGGEVKGRTVTEVSVYDNPWPIADRDFVYRIDIEKDQHLGAVVFDLTNVEHPSAPPEITPGVRGSVMMRLHLHPVDGGKKTRFVGMFWADVKGSLPVWLQNYIAGSFPSGTIKNLKKQLAGNEIPSHPIGKQLLEQILSGKGSSLAH